MAKTYGQQFEEALKCETPVQAHAWLTAEIQRYCDDFGIGPAEAENTIRANLGYMAGYYDHATAEKVRTLFSAEHPIFGANYHGKVSPEWAFEKGKQMARKAKREKVRR